MADFKNVLMKGVGAAVVGATGIAGSLGLIHLPKPATTPRPAVTAPAAQVAAPILRPQGVLPAAVTATNPAAPATASPPAATPPPIVINNPAPSQPSSASSGSGPAVNVNVANSNTDVQTNNQQATQTQTPGASTTTTTKPATTGGVVGGIGSVIGGVVKAPVAKLGTVAQPVQVATPPPSAGDIAGKVICGPLTLLGVC